MQENKELIPSPFSGLIYKIFVFFMCFLGLMLLASLISRAVMPALFHIGDEKLFWSDAAYRVQHMDAVVFAILLNGTVFILTPLVYARIVHRSESDYFKLSNKPDPISTLLAILAIVVVVPFVSLLGELTTMLPLSDSIMEAMMDASESSRMVQSKLLAIESFPQMILVLLVLAVLPALGEELLVRGGIQKMLLEEGRSGWFSVLMASLFFATIHLQFDNFLGILTYGMILGFLYLWTQNLWVSIIAHFFNNASIVLISFFSDYDVLGTSTENFSILLISGIISLLLSAGLLYLIYKRSHQNRIHIGHGME